MSLYELLRVMFGHDVRIDLYVTTEYDTHKTVFDGYSDDCPSEWFPQEVLSVYDYEDGICIGVSDPDM